MIRIVRELKWFRTVASRLVGSCIALIAWSGSVEGQDWLGFHGLDRRGVLAESAQSRAWSDEIEGSWKTAIPGFGYSSPVVSQTEVYVTTAYEKYRASNFRTALTYAGVALAWALLTITSILAIRSVANEWSGLVGLFNGARLFLLMSLVLLVVGICTFGHGLFALETLIVRSWKVGVVAAFLSLLVALLLVIRKPTMSWLFAAASTLLSIGAYVFMPLGESFFDLRTPRGIVITSVVLAPALAAWTVSIGLWLAGGTLQVPHTTSPGTRWRRHFLRFSFWCGFLALVAVSVLWSIARSLLAEIDADDSFNAPDEMIATIQPVPMTGWPFLAVAAILSLITVGAGSYHIFQRPRLRPVLVWSGVTVATLLGVVCFLSFGVLRTHRQVTAAVVCIDRTSGKIKWIREVGYNDIIHDYKGVNSHATPTIAAGTNRICAYFGSVGLYGLDTAGKTVWKVEDTEFESPYGVGHSPVVADGVVVLANDNERYSSDRSSSSHIIAYSLDDGRVLWRQARDRSEPASAGFSTPVVHTIRGQKTVIMRGWEDLTAYDLHTGKIRWETRFKHRGNHLVAGVAVDDERVYVLDGLGIRALDLVALEQGRDASSWILPIPGEKASTPVLVDGLLFVATETGNVFCIDADKGTVEWKRKLGERYFSSVIAHGKHVIFVDETGQLSVVQRGRTFELTTQMKLSEKVYATAAPQSDGLLIRAVTNLYHLRPTISSSVTTNIRDRIPSTALE